MNPRTDAVPKAVAFPGQGVARRDLVADLQRHDGHPLVAALCSELGHGPTDLNVSDTSESMPATYVAGLLNARAVFGDCLPAVVFGHSLGEITALAFTRAIDAEEGLGLVVTRGRLCAKAQADRPGAMAAILGMTAEDVEWVRRLAVGRTGGVVEIAAYNSRTQIVISGDTDTVDEAVREAASQGAAVARLAIGGGFHSPLMADIVTPFAEAVSAVAWRHPACPVVSCVDGQAHEEWTPFRDLVPRALVVPVRWAEAVTTVAAMALPAVWEAGPGATLTKLGRREKTLTYV